MSKEVFVMLDHKNAVISALERRLVSLLGEEDTATVTQELLQVLEPYEITKVSTAIMPYEAINDTLLKEYCACLLVEGKSKNTVNQYRRTIERLAKTVEKHYTDMGASDIRLYLAIQKSNGVSNRTLENTRANLSAFFQWMAREDKINKNPCATIPPIKYTDKIRLPFSAIEIDSLRSACKTDKERAIVEVLLSSGVRVSELTALKISDINFDECSIQVRCGKGGKARTTYMSELAKKHLLAYLMNRKPFGDYLFYNKKKEQLNVGGVRYILKAIGKRAGVENVHPHRFRRTFASGMARRGMDVQEIRKLLGHSDLNTTMEYVYTSNEQTQISYKKYAA